MREDKKYVLTAGLAAQTHKWPSRNQVGGSSVTFKLLSGSHYKNRHLNKTVVLGQSSQFPLFWCTKSRKSCLTRWWGGGWRLLEIGLTSFQKNRRWKPLFPLESLLVNPTLFCSILCSWYVIWSFLVARMAFLSPCSYQRNLEKMKIDVHRSV